MSDSRLTLITGGAGFVGSNLAHRLLSAGERVLVLDNLSRPGVADNLQWLRAQHGERLSVAVQDVRDGAAVREAVARARRVFHFAAQVAVTTSLADPHGDFETNALGTLNVLEAARRQAVPPSVLITSTNKVYGALDDVPLRLGDEGYVPHDPHLAAHGIGEDRPLDFHSPYGCSKGAADQYVRDYARSFGLDTVVLRMSCIYGQRQFGTEDQGWVAHFMLRALQRQPLTLYGDGQQVRDVLHVDDLLDAMLRLDARLPEVRGRIFNIGGGAANAVSLRRMVTMIEALQGEPMAVGHDGWRTGDQRYYVSDTRALQAATGWRPRVGVAEGLARLREWLRERAGPAAAPLAPAFAGAATPLHGTEAA
ncbi:NAD-dependent epimerase/dehydratase family protein [Pseudacidovorax intermedius]|uniref:CDP-paratose 2-epimerase n=1 Tax=Pseudacidovorax intermedius TaxID=433924 RepID=A0A147H587_9BURK|nr:NAD-dependent epimerase/dehydratase family protein [Pseudacidovorax intermedius]KTT25110.1 CDP-paratose 2-epimerase [Pseudacidovorax intermedius]